MCRTNHVTGVYGFSAASSQVDFAILKIQSASVFKGGWIWICFMEKKMGFGWKQHVKKLPQLTEGDHVLTFPLRAGPGFGLSCGEASRLPRRLRRSDYSRSEMGVRPLLMYCAGTCGKCCCVNTFVQKRSHLQVAAHQSVVLTCRPAPHHHHPCSPPSLAHLLNHIITLMGRDGSPTVRDRVRRIQRDLSVGLKWHLEGCQKLCSSSSGVAFY